MKTYKNYHRKSGMAAIIIAVCAMGSAFVSCGSSSDVTVLGAGASFPAPAYAEMFAKYEQETGVKVNYQSIGSGGGIKQITEETVDFGASDAFLNNEALAGFEAEGKSILHFPTMLGAIAIVYNIPGFSEQLNLTGSQIAQIFSGEITQWDDEIIKETNPNVDLPAESIIVVRRSDGSGTTDAFSRFLAFSSSDWLSDYGVGKSIDWFQGSIGAKGNEGVNAQVNNTPNSISYLSLNYALETGLPFAAVQNLTGRFIAPSLESISAAAGTVEIPSDTRINLTEIGTMGGGYPISSLTWIVAYREQNYNGRSQEQAQALKELLQWMSSNSAQNLLPPLAYAKLPQKLVDINLETAEELVFDGSGL